MNTLFFVGLAIFFVVFLWGLLRKPATRGESFFDLFAFWTWFEERDEVRIGRFWFTSYPVPRWFNVIVEHDDMQGDVYWEFVLIVFKRGFKMMHWGNTSGRYTIPKFSFSLFTRLPVRR